MRALILVAGAAMAISQREREEREKMRNSATPDQPSIPSAVRGIHDDIAVAIAEVYLCQPRDMTWEDRSEQLATAALSAALPHFARLKQPSEDEVERVARIIADRLYRPEDAEAHWSDWLKEAALILAALREQSSLCEEG